MYVVVVKVPAVVILVAVIGITPIVIYTYFFLTYLHKQFGGTIILTFIFLATFQPYMHLATFLCMLYVYTYVY